ncbi:MAG: hypothetical protein HWE18_12035 [Gammaproteobacteria bacterium]|nr:hypothetical protein [Gammaproteobacteria bacterium]
MNQPMVVTQDSMSPLGYLSIEDIKKAFIQLNQLPAANDQVIRHEAAPDHVIRVKDWLQDLERELGVKAKVVASPSVLDLSVMAPAAVVDGEPVLFANYINNQKIALDAFEYVAVGLLAVERLGLDTRFFLRIFQDLSQDQREFLSHRHDLDVNQENDQELMVKLYLADLAALNVELTWLERREAWQRQLVRLVYPKLAYSSLDLHYLLLKARRALIKA